MLMCWLAGVQVHFAGEQGMDYGALTRDWLVQTLEALANPAIALFTSVSSASLTHPSPASAVQPRYAYDPARMHARTHT